MRAVWIGLIVVLLAGLGAAPGAVRYIAFEGKTIDNTVGGTAFTVTKLQPNGGGTDPQATIAVCRLESALVRYTIDGTPPVAGTTGTVLQVGDAITITGADLLRAFRAIRETAVSGFLDCNYIQP
jgi:hypothetical protein